MADYPTLEIEADVDGDGSQETGRFVLAGNVTVAEQVQLDYLFSNKGGKLNAIIGGSAEKQLNIDKQTANRRRGIWVDVGAGAQIYEIDFTGWQGATVPERDSSGTVVGRKPLRWGNTGNPDTLTKGDATGADALTQIQVLNRYLIKGTTDSVSPATFEVGEYSPDGLYDGPLEVAIQGPKHVRTSESDSTFDGTFTAVTVENINDYKDALDRVEF